MLFSGLGLRGVGLCFLLGASGWVASALPAAAVPVSVYADGSSDFGFDPDDVAAAIGAGAHAPTAIGPLDDGSPWLRITTPTGISGSKGKSKAKPSKGSSTWTLHIDAAAPEQELANVALVILGHDPNDPVRGYRTENVGLTVDTSLPWMFVTPGVTTLSSSEPAASGPVYVAYLLGDLKPGQSYQIPVDYLLGQKLKKGKKLGGKGKAYLFPRYTYAVVSLSLPEPGTLALLALAALAVGVGTRRAR
jgi:hypothetical protein